jgi:metal-responsive CopG/Arc/MetJ family transcriptional regulator
MIESYMPTEKVAVTIQSEVLAAAERLRSRTGESRSALFNRALQGLVRTDELNAKIERYRDAYREHPETAEEVAEADALALESMQHAPGWDES